MNCAVNDDWTKIKVLTWDGRQIVFDGNSFNPPKIEQTSEGNRVLVFVEASIMWEAKGQFSILSL